jgi:adenylate cyclase
MLGILKNKLAKSLLISLIVAVIASLLIFTGFLDTWEAKVSDAFYTPTKTLDDIIILSIDDESLQKLGRWPWSRDHFANVIEYLNKSSVIGIDVSFFESAEGDSQLSKSIKNNSVVLAMEYTNFSVKKGDLYGENLLKPISTIGIPEIDYKVGFVNIFTDSDGVTRSFTPYISGVENGEHFSLVVAEEFLGFKPVLDSTRMLIKFFAPPEGYEYISYSDVYYRKINSSYFEDKIILIGATASDLHDDVIVPISNEAMPGVEVNANILQSIITRDFLNYQDDISSIGIIFIFALFAGIIIYKFRIHISTIILAILVIAYIFISVYTFKSGIILNILYPFLTIIMVYIGLLVMYYLTEERSRKWITSIFGKYVSPLVIESLIKNPDRINLGGEKRNISIFFSDIRDFTTISEKLDPEDLVKLLNEYLTEMTTIIIDDQGLVDKYMGDAIMAFWGAPLEQEDHAEKVCLSSLKMIEKLKELNEKWKKSDIPYFNIGIGINSGDAVVGNMGSSKRFDYTAMGDNVNLASRLEGLNKIYGTNIIISEKTYKNVKNKFETRKLDMVTVKGKKKALLIYELLSTNEKSNNEQRNFINYYQKGLDLYFKMNWKSAINMFQNALKIRDDQPSELLINRCKKFIINPPSENWNGVWEIQDK